MRLPGIPREQIIEELEKIGIIISIDGNMADKDNINMPDYEYSANITLEKDIESNWPEKDVLQFEAFQDSQHQMFPTMEKIEKSFKEKFSNFDLKWDVRVHLYNEWKNKAPREKIENYQIENIESKREELFQEYAKENNNIEYLVEKVRNNPQFITNAIERIRYLAYVDLQKVLKLIDHQNIFLRRLVIIALGFSKNKQAIKPLLSLITDSSKEIREETLISLGRLQYNDILPDLINLFNEFQATTFKTANYQYSISLVTNPLAMFRNVAQSIASIGNEEAFEFLCSQIPEKARFIIDLPVIIAEMKQIFNLEKVLKKILEIDSEQTVYTKGYMIEALAILNSRKYSIKEYLIAYYSKIDYEEKIDKLFTGIFLHLQPDGEEIRPIKKKLEYLRKNSTVHDTKHYSELIITRSRY